MSLAAGIGAIAGGTVSTALDWWQANHAAHQNQRYAREQMDWQEKMSNSAHQREIADLRAAGLNPILTATGGSGASTPVGQSGSIAEADRPDFSSASEMYKYLDSQKEQVESATDKNNAETVQTRKLTPVLKEQAETASAKNKAEAAAAAAAADRQNLDTDYWKEHPTQYSINKWVDTAGNALSILPQLVNMVFSAKNSSSMRELNKVRSANIADWIATRHGH